MATRPVTKDDNELLLVDAPCVYIDDSCGYVCTRCV